ncbi:MAG: hypothetical protein HY537_12780, partial [Deltaproteobacteria bacterium]|nr:hypothetical protein [Deltaproteobacteria bacterium]
IHDPDNVNTALFVDRLQLEAVMQAKAGQRVAIQRYQVPKEVLRYAAYNELGEAGDLLRAKINYEQLSRARMPLIPASLNIGVPIEIPTGITFQSAMDLLRKSIHRWNAVKDDDTAIVEKEVPEDQCVTSDVFMYMEPI